jgi:hypothetical protein
MSEVAAMKMPNAAARPLEIIEVFTHAFMLARFYATVDNFIEASLAE